MAKAITAWKMEMLPSRSKCKNRKEFQEWEREAMMRDNVEGAFEVGDDDYYHSDTRHDHSASEENNAYAEVQEDILFLKENEDTMPLRNPPQVPIRNTFDMYITSKQNENKQMPIMQ